VATAALLVWSEQGIDPELRHAFERAAAEQPQRVRAMDELRYEDAHCLIRLWSGPHARADHVQGVDESNQVLLAFIGNPTLRDGAGWRDLLTECASTGAGCLERVWPPFGAFLRDGAIDALTIAADRSGLQQIYVREGPHGSVWASTSAFALATLGATLDVEAAVEWATAGHFLTGRTFFREIRVLGCGEMLQLRPGKSPASSVWSPSAVDSTTAEYRQALADAVETYSAPEDGLFFELTGGLDSRLLLAMRLRSGAPTRTWTVGRPDDVEMRTIRRLQRVAPFDHLLLSPDDAFAAELPTLIDEMHSLASGEANVLVYTSLLVAFRGLEAVRRTSVTGSNGELARGFYWRAVAGRDERSQVRGVSVDALLRKIFRESGGLRAVFRPEVPDSEETVRGIVTKFLEASPLATPQGILDDFYLRTRMRRFAGRNISTTSLFCAQGVPYFAPTVVDAVLGLPPELKEDGRIVREAIVELSPGLASVPLGSGEAVPPASLAHPTRALRRAVGLGRKGFARYGGNLGRRIAHAPAESMPFREVAQDAAFRDFVGDLLLTPDARSLALFDRAGLTGFVEASLAGGSLSPLGLALTIELTLRRFRLGA